MFFSSSFCYFALNCYLGQERVNFYDVLNVFKIHCGNKNQLIRNGFRWYRMLFYCCCCCCCCRRRRFADTDLLIAIFLRFSLVRECVLMRVCTCICVCVFVCRFPHTVTFVSLIQIYFSSTRAIDNERKKLFIKSANTLNRFYVIQSRASVAHLFWHITVYFITAQRYGPTHWTIFVFDWVCTATAWLSVWRSDNNGKWHMHLCM